MLSRSFPVSQMTLSRDIAKCRRMVAAILLPALFLSFRSRVLGVHRSYLTIKVLMLYMVGYPQLLPPASGMSYSFLPQMHISSSFENQ